VTSEISALIERARQAVADQTKDGSSATSGDQRLQLQRVAQEFESMLIGQMLKDMRRAGTWDDESQADGLGTEAFGDTIDAELARHLAQVQGLGLSRQMLEAFDRLLPGASNGSVKPAVTSGDAGADPVPATAPGPEAAPAPANQAVQVTSSFGWRSDPMTGEAKFHKGVDLRAAYGQGVAAVGPGRVVFSGEQRGYGTTVLIEHPDGTRTRYAHLSAALVQAGATVTAGEMIGRAGQSGRATGTHLHFEVTGSDGQPIAPDRWLRG